MTNKNDYFHFQKEIFSSTYLENIQQMDAVTAADKLINSRTVMMYFTAVLFLLELFSAACFTHTYEKIEPVRSAV